MLENVDAGCQVRSDKASAKAGFARMDPRDGEKVKLTDHGNVGFDRQVARVQVVGSTSQLNRQPSSQAYIAQIICKSPTQHHHFHVGSRQ